MRYITAVTVELAFITSGLAAPPADRVLWRHERPGDAPLTLAVLLHEKSPADLLVGYDSGRISRLNCAPAASPRESWFVQLDGPVDALLPIDMPTGRLIIAGSGRGLLAAWPDDAATESVARWQRRAGGGVHALARLTGPNRSALLLVGAADQRVRLLDPATGKERWSTLLEAPTGNMYVHAVAEVGDIDGDEHADAVAWTWAGVLVALNGKTGAILWQRKINAGFTDAFAPAGYADGDGAIDFVVGGNEGKVSLCLGADGRERWTSTSGMTERLRTVRCVACCGPLAVAGAANGVMASYRLDAWGENLPGWNEIVDSTIRAVLDNGDVVVATEGGIVSAYGGFSGSTWWWKGSDVVRTLAAVGDVDADSNPDIAAAMLDGLVVVLSSRPPSPEELMVPLPMNHSHAVPPASDRPVMTAVPATANAEEVPILLYHDVVPEVHYRWGVSLENFRMQMDELVKRGYTAVTLDEVADWIEGRRTLPARSVCITFDGPYEGHALYVRDILRERKLKAALYITSDWIGTVNHADWHQLRAMEKSGVITIENHTQNHRNLPELTPRLVRLQLAGCNEAIARHLGGKVSRHHAYPSGVYNDEVAGLLKDKGFRTATTVDPGPATRKSDLFKLPRYTLKNDTTIEQFRGWLRE